MLDKKIIELKSLVEAAELSLQQARKILIELAGTEEEKALMNQARKEGGAATTSEGQTIEGVFDGQNMVGPDGKKYSVPANYASKSKLVEGDNLKLTILADGSFVYKQIHLLDRDRLSGELAIDDKTSEYRVVANNKAFKVLTASITYFKGEVGDKVTILTPKGRESSWAAVENVIKGGEQPAETEVMTTLAETAPKNDEFLKEEKKAELTKTEEVKDGDDSRLSEVKIESKPEDIFAATEKINTEDVKEVSINPPSMENNNPDMVDDLDKKDGQGLEEI